MSQYRGKSKRKKEDNASAYKKLRRKLLRCALCKPHRGENAKRKGRKKKKVDRTRAVAPKRVRQGCPPNCPGCEVEDRYLREWEE